MRNKYPGICYQCGKRVEKGGGHFERYKGHWRTQHADCAIEHRKIREREYPVTIEANRQLAFNFKEGY